MRINGYSLKGLAVVGSSSTGVRRFRLAVSPSKNGAIFCIKIQPQYLYLPFQIIYDGHANGFSDEAKFFMRGIIFNGISFMANYPYIVFGVAFSWINAIYGRGVG